VTKYLGLFQQFLRSIFPKPEQLPAEVGPGERLSRYVFTKSHLKKSRGCLSPEAFTPPNTPREISVYRTDGCSEQTIWELADKHVTPHRRDHKPAKGRGDLEAQIVFDHQLRVIPHPIPHPRHANIVDWPDEPGSSLELLKATELANRARLILRPANPAT
jgi:hypothetical protein